MDDRQPLKKEGFLKKIFGKLFADKGYISKTLFEILLPIHLVTGIRNKMKNSLMTMNDKIMLRKRSVIETVNDELKNIYEKIVLKIDVEKANLLRVNSSAVSKQIIELFKPVL